MKSLILTYNLIVHYMSHMKSQSINLTHIPWLTQSLNYVNMHALNQSNSHAYEFDYTVSMCFLRLNHVRLHI